MFKAAANKGFSMTFENGNTVSVQWGPGNYCDRKGAGFDAPMKPENLKGGFWESGNAGVAAWNADKEWHNFGTFPDGRGAQVQGYRTPRQVAEFIAFVGSNELNTAKEKETDNAGN